VRAYVAAATGRIKGEKKRKEVLIAGVGENDMEGRGTPQNNHWRRSLKGAPTLLATGKAEGRLEELMPRAGGEKQESSQGLTRGKGHPCGFNPPSGEWNKKERTQREGKKGGEGSLKFGGRERGQAEGLTHRILTGNN